MKNIGVVKEYNGFYGKIENLKGDNYILLKKEIMGNDQINKLDVVSFVPENYTKDDIDEKIARFVKKLEKENIKVR